MKILHISHQGINKTYIAVRTSYYWPTLKEDCQQMTQSCIVYKELNPKAPANPKIEPTYPITNLKPFKSVGLDMISRKGIQYLLVLDHMLGYIFMENMNRHAPCKLVTKKFKLLCLTYKKPCQVRYNKGPPVQLNI